MHRRRGSFFFVLLVSALAVASCTQENYPLDLYLKQHPFADASVASGEGGPSGPLETRGGGSSGGGDGDSGVAPGSGTCRQAHAQPLPLRLAALTTPQGTDASAASASGNTVYVSDLYNRFDSLCGNCHGPSLKFPNGGFGIPTPADFSGKMTQSVLDQVSDGKAPGGPPMPPGRAPYSQLLQSEPDGPMVAFVNLVQAWISLGSPPSFVPTTAAMTAAGSGDAGAGVSYLLPPETGNAMTNLGSCIPDKSLVATETTTSLALDAKFASATSKKSGPTGGLPTALESIGLPEHLSETDLFTFDTATLARHGVIAFQPTYPLWSDDAGKLRFVRVPRGTSIVFDKSKQEFTIPANTRFYKTFLKRIIDTDGSYRWRKIETRLIVSRPDTPKDDGSGGVQVNALFGSYQWNGDETDAKLVDQPLRNGLPFTDTVLSYVVDEQLAAEVLASSPLLPEETLLEAHATRHYAIPSSDRCIDCHEGSPSASFVLGFRPIQINRRPEGFGGVIAEPGQERPGPDELTQLQRLVDYGIVTGITSPADVLPLESAEGSRAPRNPNELVAQGYMIGNCSHCHNPRGKPSVANPVLRDLLNFVPGPDSGIFQFPLERMSPRIARGPGGNEPLPYITPSLMDLPPSDWKTAASGQAGTNEGYQSKADNGASTWALFAPWRSLIYRNVHNPFPYTDNLALFPHMPMNTPGYDCRAQQILGDWMVSIPAIRKNPQIPEYAFDTTQSPVLDDAPQPYVEVLPGSADYEPARAAADVRLHVFKTGISPDSISPVKSPYSVHDNCPDTSDILDPQVILSPACHPVPLPAPVPTISSLTLFTAGHAHWVKTDLTQPPGWVPRGDWLNVLVPDKVPGRPDSCTNKIDTTDVASQQVAVDLLQSVHIDQPLVDLATHDFPMGVWAQKPDCDFSAVPKASSFVGQDRPQWMDVGARVHSNDPIYVEWPGAAVFNFICINCHGPSADGKGRVADNLLIMTGGKTRVADFKDGLFGPVESPGSNRQAVFDLLGPGSDAGVGAPANASANWTTAPGVAPVAPYTPQDERAARYMPWMALGGTASNIPRAILDVVGNTQILGARRGGLPPQPSPNMLGAVKEICASLLANKGSTFEYQITRRWFDVDSSKGLVKTYPELIGVNGDAELWLRLCSLDNPPPVRAIALFNSDGNLIVTGVAGIVDNGVGDSLIAQGSYGTNPVGNWLGASDPDGIDDPSPPSPCPRGGTRDSAGLCPCANGPTGHPAPRNASGICSNNYFPWCIRVPPATDPTYQTVIDYVTLNHLPACPFATVGKYGLGNPLDATFKCTNGCLTDDDRTRWAMRGAINAGLAVFLYLDAVSKGKVQIKPDYDRCDLLKTGAGLDGGN